MAALGIIGFAYYSAPASDRNVSGQHHYEANGDESMDILRQGEGRAAVGYPAQLEFTRQDEGLSSGVIQASDPCSLLTGSAKTSCENNNKKTSKKSDPCRWIKGAAKDLCKKGNKSTSSSDPYYGTEKPNVPLPPSPAPGPSGRLPTNVPRPAAQGVPSEVANPVTTLLRWTTWGVCGLCVFGVTGVGFQMTIKHRSGEIGAHATGLAWVGVACFVAASASAIIANVLG